MKKWQINIREDGLTLLEALSLRVPAAPRAFLRQSCKKQRVLINDITADANRKVYDGDTITVKASVRFSECLELSHIHPEQILYEDKECFVLNKPAGLAIHNAQGHEDNLLLRLGKFSKLRGETFQVSPIQRLDIGTSGAVLFGKGRASISQFGQAITEGHFSKRYLALVSAEITNSGELTTSVPAKGKIKEAKTRFRPVVSNAGYTLLELELGTGRQHQIRRQLSDFGWPIVGDLRYHGRRINGLNRPFLHCHHLSFPHPEAAKPVSICCALAKDLSLTLKALNLSESCILKKTE